MPKLTAQDLIALYPGTSTTPPLSLPEEFSQSTLLALKAQQEILRMVLDEHDPNYRAKLAAKAQLSSAQITAQLKLDETRLRGQLAAMNYYDELRDALVAYNDSRDKPI